jgi:hypothetical protein
MDRIEFPKVGSKLIAHFDAGALTGLKDGDKVGEPPPAGQPDHRPKFVEFRSTSLSDDEGVIDKEWW